MATEVNDSLEFLQPKVGSWIFNKVYDSLAIYVLSLGSTDNVKLFTCVEDIM